MNMNEIARELHDLAQHVQTTWSNYDTTTDPTHRHERMRWLWRQSVEAGGLLMQAVDQGAFGDDEQIQTLIEQARQYPREDARANAAFLLIAQHWLPQHAEGYGGKGMSYPKRHREPVERMQAGGSYAASMEALARLIEDQAGDADEPAEPRSDWWKFTEAWRHVQQHYKFDKNLSGAAAQSMLNRWADADPDMSEGKRRDRRIDPAKVRKYCKTPPI